MFNNRENVIKAFQVTAAAAVGLYAYIYLTQKTVKK